MRKVFLHNNLRNEATNLAETLKKTNIRTKNYFHVVLKTSLLE
jgi:hypothetical protein